MSFTDLTGIEGRGLIRPWRLGVGMLVLILAPLLPALQWLDVLPA